MHEDKVNNSMTIHTKKAKTRPSKAPFPKKPDTTGSSIFEDLYKASAECGDEAAENPRKKPGIVPFLSTYSSSTVKSDMLQKTIISYLVPADLELSNNSSALCGSFVESGTCFRLNGTYENIAPLQANYIDDRFKGLLKYLTNEAIPYWIVGNTLGKSFHVRGIHIIKNESSIWNQFPGNEKESAISDRTLQAIICRLFSSSVPYYDIPLNNKFSFSSEAQLKILFDSCKCFYPEGIIRWAAQTLHDINAGYYSSDIKRHAVKALSYVLNVDWQSKKEVPCTLPEIQKILDERFFALDEVKQAILEAAAYIRHTGHAPKWGILLVGPPGTGKTAIAKAAAEALNRPFGQLDFSVETDMEAMCGSSRIYNNAKPGLLYEQIFAAKTGNMVMLLNEIDKCGQSRRGDVTNILLSLLDGHGYTDSYIECTVPTDGIFCIATANDISRINAPLLSRFRIIELPPYSYEDKLNIFNRYIFPLACKRASLAPKELCLSETACKTLVNAYAPTSGVRDLEQAAEHLVQCYLKEKELEKLKSAVYRKNDIIRILGKAEEEPFVITDPGESIGTYQVDGESGLFKLQAIIQQGVGEFRTINIDDSQLSYCNGAYEAFKQCVHDDMSTFDIVLFADRKLPALEYNYIGLPVCAALYSALKNIVLSSSEVFAGGCDLFGNIRLYQQKIQNIIRKIDSAGKNIYILYTAACAMNLCDEPHCGVCVIENNNIRQLFSLMDLKASH